MKEKKIPTLKITDGVFIDAIKNVRLFNSGTQPYFDLAYEDLTNELQPKLYQLALMEEVIIQKRCVLNLVRNPKDEIKLSFVRDYVYARAPFFRREKDTNDIRVLIKKTSIIYPENPNPTLEQLYQDETFMDNAKVQLFEAMNQILFKKSKTYDSVYGKYFLPL